MPTLIIINNEVEPTNQIYEPHLNNRQPTLPTSPDDWTLMQHFSDIHNDPPTYLQDYEVRKDNDLNDDSKEDVSHYALFSYCDLMIYDEVAYDNCWTKAINEEIQEIKKNNAWKLTILPKRKRC